MTSAPPDIATNIAPAVDLLLEIFKFAEGAVFFTTLPNERFASNGSRHERICEPTREALAANIGRVLEKYDREGQSCYFGVASYDHDKYRLRAATEDSGRGKDTVAEIVCLHIDIDLKGSSLAWGDVCGRLAQLRLPPSVIVNSGNGLHAYWLLTEALEATPDQIIEHEALLKAVAAMLRADGACAEVSRVLRLPCSHNTKNGDWKEVFIVAGAQGYVSDFTRRYHWSELAHYFQVELSEPLATEQEIPTIRRTALASPRGSLPDDPWSVWIREQIAAGVIRMPPHDVDRLLEMMSPGDAEHGVHSTTLVVTASLVARGWTKDEIVPFVMGGIASMVTTSGLPRGWPENWSVNEERKLIGMIDSAARKQDPARVAEAQARRRREQMRAIRDDKPDDLPPAGADEPSKSDEAHEGAALSISGNNVFELVPKPARSQKSRAHAAESTHATLARKTIADLDARGVRFCFWKSDLWIFRTDDPVHAGLWRAYEGKDQANWIETEVHSTIRDANEAAKRVAEDDRREPGEIFDDTKRLRGEVRAFIHTMPNLHYADKWDTHGLTPLANGLFDAKTLTLTPYASEHRATWRFAAPWEPGASFANGERMIADIFAPHGEDAPAYVRLLRQFAYVAIFMQGREIGRQLRRCLYLVGEKNSGKSQYLDLMRRAVGEQLCSTTTLDQLSSPQEGRFALEPLMDKAMWCADEAATEKTKVDAGRLKALLAEDFVQADAKGRKAVVKRFLGAAMFSSNSWPQTLDRASGFSDRFMLVRCPATFDNEDPRGVALLAREKGYANPARFVAETELAGLVCWALGERDWIEKEMRFEQPGEVRDAREKIADNANPVRSFLRECVIPAGLAVGMRTVDLYEVYREWHAEDDGDKHYCLKPRKFWSLVGAFYGEKRGLVPREILRRDHLLVAAGLRLGENGMDYWHACSTKKAAGDKGVSSSLTEYASSVHFDIDAERVVKIAAHFKVEQAPAPTGAKDTTPRF